MIYFIIVCYQSERWLDRCLATVFDRGSSDVSCLLIDNAAMTQEDIQALQKRYPRVRYIRTGSNLNYGGGNNLGIEIALNEGAEFISLINPDTWFEPDWLRPLIEAFKEYPDFGILSPFQLQYDNHEPALWSVGNILSGRSLKEVRKESLVELPFTEGSCMVIRRSVLEKIGGFDPIYDMYYEEIDLCRRARRAGFRVGIVTTAFYHHFGSGNTTDIIQQQQRNITIDKSQFISMLTCPEYSWRYNHLRVLYWLLRRAGQWLTGQRPYFLHLLKSIRHKYEEDYSMLYHKWQRDRLIA